MSQNRFKVSKADTDGADNTKQSFRRVNLSTDIELNIIESCKDFFCAKRGRKPIERPLVSY